MDGCVEPAWSATVRVSASNGFSQFATSWTIRSDCRPRVPGPGQTMQPVTYILTGTVVISYCLWSHFANACTEASDEYAEWAR